MFCRILSSTYQLYASLDFNKITKNEKGYTRIELEKYNPNKTTLKSLSFAWFAPGFREVGTIASYSRYMDIPDFENHYKARKIILIDLTHHSGLFTNYYESNNRSSLTNDYLYPAITATACPALWLHTLWQVKAKYLY